MKRSKAKTISSIIIVLALILMQVVIPLQASANPPLNWDNPNQGGNNSYKLSLSNVVSSGLLTSLVGCTGIVNKVAKVTTDFLTGLVTNAKDKAALKIAANAAKLTSVPSVDSTHANQTLTDAQKALDKQKEIQFRNDCLDGIAVRLARNQLTAMTRNTMNWINTGFNGDPLFVRNVNSYMDSLTQEILQREEDLFKDPTNSFDYPYGRDYARSQVESYKASQDTYGAMKQDLTNYLEPGATTDSFATDFSQGGWSGWLALTQHPQNNPLGFNMLATENLANQENTATQDAKATIARNDGFLDQQQCVEWENPSATSAINPNQAYANLCKTITDANRAYCQANAPQAASGAQAQKCIRYETVTPGSLIKDKATKYLNSPETQLELVKTLNDALNSLFASLLDTFQHNGLSSLSSTTNANPFTDISGGAGSNSVLDSNGNVISTNGSGSSSSGSGPNGAFDITKDLGNTYINPTDEGSWNAQTNTPQLLPGEGVKGQFYTVTSGGSTKISTAVDYWSRGDKAYFNGTSWQRGVPTYIIDKNGSIQNENDFISVVNQSTAVLSNVIPSLGKLDYCIPGPNPNWHTNAQDSINTYLDSISNGGTATIDPSTLDQTLNDYQAKVDARYGPNSPMQSMQSGNSSALQMAQAGLAITKDIPAYADTIAAQQDDNRASISDGSTTMAKLNDIKNQVNVIIAAAQRRRDTKRAQAGLPKVSALCTATEKVTYISNGVLK